MVKLSKEELELLVKALVWYDCENYTEFDKTQQELLNNLTTKLIMEKNNT